LPTELAHKAVHAIVIRLRSRISDAAEFQNVRLEWKRVVREGKRDSLVPYHSLKSPASSGLNMSKDLGLE
jgi:hypothetical protein